MLINAALGCRPRRFIAWPAETTGAEAGVERAVGVADQRGGHRHVGIGDARHPVEVGFGLGHRLLQPRQQRRAGGTRICGAGSMARGVDLALDVSDVAGVRRWLASVRREDPGIPVSPAAPART